MNKVKAIVFLGASVVVAAAALVLVLMNLGDSWTLHFYWKSVQFSRALVLLGAGCAGIAVWLILRRCLPAGIRALRAVKAGAKSKAAEKRLAELESKKPSTD